MTQSTSSVQAKPSRPWYREPFTWLVFGLPATSIVTSLTLVSIAVNNRDPVLDRNVPMVQLDPHKLRVLTPEQRAIYEASLRPAREARNHAASPEMPLPRP